MWIYLLKKHPKPDYKNIEYWSVGFFEPTGFWREVKQCVTEDSAETWVHYLNGGEWY